MDPAPPLRAQWGIRWRATARHGRGTPMARHAICAGGDVPRGAMKAFKIAGQSLLVIHLEDGLYATQASSQNRESARTSQAHLLGIQT